jgi:hypothetical protein
MRCSSDSPPPAGLGAALPGPRARTEGGGSESREGGCRELEPREGSVGEALAASATARRSRAAAEGDRVEASSARPRGGSSCPGCGGGGGGGGGRVRRRGWPSREPLGRPGGLRGACCVWGGDDSEQRKGVLRRGEEGSHLDEGACGSEKHEMRRFVRRGGVEGRGDT